MLPRWNQYGDWPASGEIDLAEIRGNANLQGYIYLDVLSYIYLTILVIVIYIKHKTGYF